MTSPAGTHITSVLKETRSFPPSTEFAARAHIKSLAEYEKLWQRAHDDPDAVTDMECLPPSLADKTYYRPTERGFEKEIKRRLELWDQYKQGHRAKVKGQR